ncbi:hypothetical protein JCM30471_18580 [Desulfuromonas carbonis]
MKRWIWISLLALCLVAAGCSTSRYLLDKPYILHAEPAAGESGAAVQERAMKALLDAFAEYRWEVRGLDRENHTVTAQACRGGELCAEVLATVQGDGSVELLRSPGTELSQDEELLLRRWLANINRSYQKRMRVR